MRVIPFTVPHHTREAFRVQEDLLKGFYDKLHQHPETQIMHILKSEGTLIAGDYVGRFEAGDVYLIGSGQPHVFRNDSTYYQSDNLGAHALSVYFSEQYSGKEFWQLEEMKEIRSFLAHSGKGFKVTGATREEIKQKIFELSKLQGLEKFICFLSVLNIFASSKELTPLGVTPYPKSYSATEEKRMNDILQFTFSESHRKISIHEVAQVANLSNEAFCRYFKTRTRKTYSNFLNEVKISSACKLFIEKELSVEQVCYHSGFSNLSNFNRIFKKITGKTPSKYIQ